MKKGLKIIRERLVFNWFCIVCHTINCSMLSMYGNSFWKLFLMLLIFLLIGKYFSNVLVLCERRDAIKRWMPIHNLIHPEQ